MIFTVRQALTTSALGLALGASGCQLELNGELIKNEVNKPPVCPPGLVCTLAPADAGGPKPDLDGGSGSPILDGGGAVACLQDDQCAVDSYCSVKKVCRPRCDAARGCVAPHTGGPLDVSSLLSAEGSLLWGSGTTYNALENSRHDGAIWRMTEDGKSTVVVSGLERPILVGVVDGVIYLYEYGSTDKTWPLLSAPLSGGTATALRFSDGAVHNVKSSESYLWWTRQTGGTEAAPTTELWRRPRHGSPTDEHVKDLPGWALLAATDNAVVYTGPHIRYDLADSRTLMLDNLNGAAPIVIDEQYGHWAETILTDHSLIARKWHYGLDFIKRYGLSGAGTGEHIAPKPIRIDMIRMTDHAPWVLWESAVERPSENGNAVVMRFGRSQIDGTAEPETLLDVRFEYDTANVQGMYGLFALAPWGNELVYLDTDERRLVRARVAAFPCSSSLRCPEGSTCQPDQTCH